MPRSRGGPGGLRQAGAPAGRAHLLLEELFHPFHALLVLHLGPGVLHGVDGVVVGKVQLRHVVRVLGVVENVLLLRRAVVDDVLLPVRQVPEGHVGAHPHGPAHVGHQGPHEALPGGHRPLVNGEGVVRHQGGQVYRPHHAGAPTGPAGPLAVEGQLLRPRGIESGPAGGAGEGLPRRHRQGGGQVVPVGAAVAGQAGVHQAQGVEQLRPRAEGGADPRHPRPLVEGQGGGDVAHRLHLRLGGLGHPPPGVGGQGLQVPPGPLGIHHPQGQGGLAGAGHPGNPHHLVKRDVHIQVLQVVDLGPPYLDPFGGRGVGGHGPHLLSLQKGRAPCRMPFLGYRV